MLCLQRIEETKDDFIKKKKKKIKKSKIFNQK
jgi:hypothetical protein